ncbi:MAG: C40 family peptidase [Prevotellaceae bacterium]|jgi:hypothetical protein|nr:C40 family peptidase [Prevotellaceae bacterium]
MKKKRNMYLMRLPIFLLAAQLFGSGCATLRQPAQQADGDFYRSYSKKMGVSFDGTEDKSLIRASAEWLGVPYRYGGQNRSGIDCSALVGSVYREAYGITLPRSTSAIAKQAKRVKKGDLACGDLLFFTIKDKKVSHVGVYLANGKFLHASTSKGVSVADLGNTYWSKYFSGAGRVRTPSSSAGKGGQLAQQLPPAAAAKKSSAAAAKPKPAKSAKPATGSDESGGSDVIIVFDEEF